MDLEGKVALVTGGRMGIGRATALDLATNGANVAIVSRHDDSVAREVIAKIEALGRSGLSIQSNVGVFAEAASVVKRVIDTFGHLDILVNNAGINRDAMIWKMEEAQWDEVIGTNLKGYFNYIRAVAPFFKEQGHGVIINIISINALRGKLGQANYSASKAGIIGLTKTVAKELGKYNVNVNAVAPGLIETDMVARAPESVREMAVAESALGRIGNVEDVAYLVSFLCSPRAAHITGEVIKVDGGQYI
jgi:3-oxoacyl-[acyl-carrier protein] reductase